MTAGLDALAGRAGSRADQPLAAAVVRLDAPSTPATGTGVSWLGWPNDLVVRD